LAIVRTPRRHHELDVLHVLAVVELELVDRHVDEMRAGYRSEFFEGGEEFVVTRGQGGSWQEPTHRETHRPCGYRASGRGWHRRRAPLPLRRTATLPARRSGGRRKALAPRPKR